MAEVACFCGSYFSFEGGAGACPKCGREASVTALPRSQAERGTPVAQAVPAPRDSVDDDGSLSAELLLTSGVPWRGPLS
jgi:hypothetical protein